MGANNRKQVYTNAIFVRTSDKERERLVRHMNEENFASMSSFVRKIVFDYFDEKEARQSKK